MTFQEYLLQLIAEYLVFILTVQQWTHDLFGLFRIRVWRTGPVCACAP